MADGAALSQVLDNLLSNAIKFSTPGKQIRLTVCPPGAKWVEYQVQDEGPGFSEDDKARMFRRYGRLSAAICRYSWPGNLREMRNSIERAVITAQSDKFPWKTFPRHCAVKSLPYERRRWYASGCCVDFHGATRGAHIRKVIERTANLAEAAQLLGVDQATLYRKRKKIGLE